MINSRDLGRFYKLSTDKGVPPLKSPDSSLIAGSNEKANTFKEYLACMFTINDSKTPVCTKKV
jgi:hypothetical protein